MTSALVIGEALIDVVHKHGAPPTHHPGGSPANVAIGLARLGRAVDLATWIGHDPDGALLRTHFTLAGVELVPGSERAERTPTATATLSADGSAAYAFDLQWRLPEVHLDSGVGLVHTGSIAAALPPGADGVVEILAAARPTSTITYDPNIRPAIMGVREEVRTRVENILPLCDVVKVSAEDLTWLYPGDSPALHAREWAAAGVPLVVHTRGAEGAVAYTSSGMELGLESPRVTVADTVGAGDSFMAGLLDALWEAGLIGAEARIDLRGIDRTTLHHVLNWAVHCAALTVTRAGANPPTRAEVEKSLGHL